MSETLTLSLPSRFLNAGETITSESHPSFSAEIVETARNPIAGDEFFVAKQGDGDFLYVQRIIGAQDGIVARITYPTFERAKAFMDHELDALFDNAWGV